MNQNYPYNYNQYRPVYQKPVSRSNGVGVAALVCGIVGFILNPFYLVCLAAIILGIVGLCLKGKNKGTAITGLILGSCALIFQFIIDLIFSVLTMGLSFLI